MATQKQIKSKVERLNSAFKFPGRKYVKLKNGKTVTRGRGFVLGQAYGGYQLRFESAKTNQAVSPGYLKAKEFDTFLDGFRKGVFAYMDRTKKFK